MMIWRFRRMIEAFGADPARWPADERAAGDELLRRSAAARAALAEARELDARLQWERPVSDDPALADRIIARARAHPQEPSPMNSPLPLREGDRGRGTQMGVGRGTQMGVGRGTQMGIGRGPYFRFGLWPQLAGLAAAGLLGFILGAADLGPSSSDNSPDGSIDLSDIVDLNSDLEDPLS